MNTEEIKQKYKMIDVLAMYGISVDRNGFCNCPFHKEKTASMKIYEHSFSCFGCRAGGDIFNFVMRMDKCDFKTAFYNMGGTYEHEKKNARIVAKMNRERALKERERIEKKKKRNTKLIADTMTEVEEIIHGEPPLSDLWCLAQNYKPILIGAWEHTQLEERGDKIDGFIARQCKQFRIERDSIKGTTR